MTPAETAKNEAAKQAVGLAFAIAGCVALILLQKKLGGGIMSVVEAEHDRIDPSGARIRRMEAAQKAADRWHRRAVWLWRFGPWKAAEAAHRRAEAARKIYEAERYS